MTKQELEEKIAKGESVWLIDLYTLSIKEYSNLMNIGSLIYGYDGNGTSSALSVRNTLNRLYNTKAEAEHHLHHANITRTETLPFLTWEEFKQERYFGFYTTHGEWIGVYVTNGLEPNKLIITIENQMQEEFINNYDFTEEDFYKAYDECVKLFKGEGEN